MGCRDKCAQLQPAFQLDLTTAEPTVESLEVTLELNGNVFERSFDVQQAFDDRAASFGLHLDGQGIEEEFEVRLTVTGYPAPGGAGTAVAYGEGTFQGTPDGCNRFALALGRNQGQNDGGVGQCGNGIIDPGESCDGSNLGGLDCLRLGYLPGTGSGLQCDPQCSLTDPAQSCLGGPIDSAAQLEAAFQYAASTPEHDVMAMRPGRYVFPDLIEISVKDGVTLQPPPGGQVEIQGGFRVISSNNVIQGLAFVDTDAAVIIEGDKNTVRGIEVRGETVAPRAAIEVLGEQNLVTANRVVSRVAGPDSAGVVVNGGDDNTLTMNVVIGDLGAGFRVASQGRQDIDQNTVWITGGAGTAMVLLSLGSPGPPASFCVRNNILAGQAGSTGLDLGSSIRFGGCGGKPSSRNAVVGHGIRCTGECSECDGGGLCDLDEDPGFLNDHVCVTGTALVDGGLELGLDLVDGDPLNFLGIAPDVGARETGSSRSYGGSASDCP